MKLASISSVLAGVGIASLAIVSLAQANVPFASAPAQTPAQAKYFDWENQAGGLHCAPKGKLKELVNDPYDCYIDLDECKASFDTLTGKIDPGFIELFADMAATDAKAEKAKFLNICPGESGPEFVELLAIKGLGYSRNVKFAPLLTQLVDGARAKKVGRGLRDAVTEALAFMGDRAAAEPAYLSLLAVESQDPEYKDTILAMLGRWQSDAGVEYCTGALTNEAEKKIYESCAFYLGLRKVKAAVPAMQRGLEAHETVTIRAFGQMGDKALLKDVRAYLDEKDGAPARVRVPALVAAINLGDAKALAELQIWLAGKRAPKKDAKPKKGKDDSYDHEFVMMAAMECILLKDAKAIAAVKKVLSGIKKDEKEWRAYVYATIALAQMGDAKGIATLAELLNSPKDDIRKAAINALGGRDMHPGEYWFLTGYGYVADAKIATALEGYYAAESKKEAKKAAVRALGTTRAMMVGKK